MTNEEALKIGEIFLCKDCSLKRTQFAYDENEIWCAVDIAFQALKKYIKEQEEKRMTKFNPAPLFYDIECERYSEDCDKIYQYLNSTFGDDVIPRNCINYVWRRFSVDCWGAGFMEPDDTTLEEFVRWLEENEVII